MKWWKRFWFRVGAAPVSWKLGPGGSPTLSPAVPQSRSSFPPTSFEGYRGGWAVVTGSSRGLGMGYATALAQRGINVVLIARKREALNALCRQLSTQYSVDTHAIAADLSVQESFAEIESELARLDKPISILINNAGGSPPQSFNESDPFYEWDPRLFTEFLAFNTHPTIHLTQMVLPGMIARNKGYILNVSSLNGLTALDEAAMYCAAKAYVISHSACLSEDLRRLGANVAIECVCPGRVATDGIGMRGSSSGDVPDPVDFANVSLDCALTPNVKIPWRAHWDRRRRYGRTGHFDMS